MPWFEKIFIAEVFEEATSISTDFSSSMPSLKSFFSLSRVVNSSGFTWFSGSGFCGVGAFGRSRSRSLSSAFARAFSFTLPIISDLTRL